MLICGVDDAGRRSLLGPIIIAGVSVNRSKIRKLGHLGICDPKKLSQQKEKNSTIKLLILLMITMLQKSILSQSTKAFIDMN